MYPYPYSSYTTVNTTKCRASWGDTLSYGILQSFRGVYNHQLKDFFRFIRKMEVEFEKIRLGMDYINEDATHHNGDDQYTPGWAGIGMMPIAVYLYYLRSWGVEGKILECGVFKGGSTCCLSHVCDYLGLELIAADSYEGLPESDGFYGKGDFRGRLGEVQGNMEKFGKPEVITYSKGWFEESLRDMNEELMLIWIDVDLRKSVVDVLSNTFHHLVKHGVIFCDGLGATRDFKDDHLIPASSESAGLLDFFSERNIAYKAIYSGFGHMGLVVPGTEHDDIIIYTPQLIQSILLGSKSLRFKVNYFLRRGLGRVEKNPAG